MRTALAALLVALVASVVPAGAQLIDRILAVVAGEPITLSDVMAAIQLGLFLSRGYWRSAAGGPTTRSSIANCS